MYSPNVVKKYNPKIDKLKKMIPTQLGDHFYELIEKCLRWKPEERLTASKYSKGKLYIVML